MILPPPVLWRVFPWNPRADDGQEFSPAFVPRVQGRGRFDLPGIASGVQYFAESPEHAVAERIQPLRGQTMQDQDLLFSGHRLAISTVALPAELRGRVIDLCDARSLVELDVGPDETASRRRAVTQEISSRVEALGYTGLRWWSVFFGDWHTVVIFMDRQVEALVYGTPERLTLEHSALRNAAAAIGVAI